MQAKVKENYRHSRVRAHTGREYTKTEWRFAPDSDTPCALLDYKTAVSTTDNDMTTKELRAAAKFASVWKRGMSREEMIAALGGG